MIFRGLFAGTSKIGFTGDTWVYYAFAGVTMAWEAAFFVIAKDPIRFRPLMIPSVLEKLTYVGTVIVLCLQRRLAFDQLMFAGADLVFGLLFLAAFAKTAPITLPGSET